MRTNVQIFCTLILKTGVLYDTMEVWKKEGRKRRFEAPPRRGLKARREVCLRGGSRGVQKSFMQNASAWHRQRAARSFLCPNAANKRTCTGSAFRTPVTSGKSRRGSAWVTNRPAANKRTCTGSAFPHAGRGRAKAAGGARGWQTVLPQISGLARGSAYPHAGRGREKAAGGSAPAGALNI